MKTLIPLFVLALFLFLIVNPVLAIDADEDGFDSSIDCDDSDPTEFPGQEWYADCDGDGHFSPVAVIACDEAEANAKSPCLDGMSPDGGWSHIPGDDCNDEDLTVYPGAIEIIGDGVDQDCDGCETCYLDADDDGYRPDDTSTTTGNCDLTCDGPGEAEATDPVGDCDDSNPGVYPGAIEIPGDYVDQDCDMCDDCYQDLDEDGFGSATIVTDNNLDCDDTSTLGTASAGGDCDDTDPLEFIGQVWCADCDGDGYFRAPTIIACDVAEANANSPCQDMMPPDGGWSHTSNGDCNDEDPTVYPGATEIIGDGIDQDCDMCETCYVDADDDGWRPDDTSTTTGNCDLVCDGPGEAEATDPIGDCDDSDANINPDATEIPGNSIDENCDGYDSLVRPFTYQGRLLDNNIAANGLYDFQFELYDDPNLITGIQMGSTQMLEDIEVIDGYFVVELLLGNVYTGGALWLEVAVRPYDSTTAYTILSPRQLLTPTPYSLFAYATNWDTITNIPADIADGDDNTDTTLTESQVDAFVADNGYIQTETDPTVPANLKDGIAWSEVSQRPAGLDDGDDNTQLTEAQVDAYVADNGYLTSETDPQVGSNTTNYISKWNGSSLIAGTIYDDGDIGIGTNNPQYKLDVRGDRIHVQDASGDWIAMRTDGTLLDFTFNGASLAIKGTNAGEHILLNPAIDSKVGIRTWIPAYDLDVNGNIRAIGSIYYGGTAGNADGTAYTKPDFVFEDGYDALSTDDVHSFLQTQGHLPWMTSAKVEKQENGDVVDMTRMSFETVETVENLQLQIIQLSEKNKALEDRIAMLEKLVAEQNK